MDFAIWMMAIRLGDRQNLHDHLLAAEERVADELASSQRDRLFSVRHLCGEESIILPEIEIQTDIERCGCRWRSLSIKDVRKV